jgi:hypothetical protein
MNRIVKLSSAAAEAARATVRLSFVAFSKKFSSVVAR